MRWAEIIHHQHTWFISLLDAKPPLSFWILALLRLVYPADPLLAGRLLSVAAGLGSCIVIYQLGKVLDGVTAALITAALYAVFPYAVFYDRIIYTEALINLFSIGLIWCSARILKDSESRNVDYVVCGLVLGFGLLCKTTILQLSFAPALAVALSVHKAYKPLIATYGIALVFPLVSMFFVPNAPTFDTNHLILHQQQFFTPIRQLLHDPFFNIRENFPRLLSYYVTYVGPVLLAFAVVSSVYLARRKPRIFVFLAAMLLLPVLVQLFVLEYFPSRYPFSDTWPLLVICSIAAADFAASRQRRRKITWVVVSALLLAMAARSLSIIRYPKSKLHPDDAEQFLGAHPYAGYGALQAVDFLKGQASQSGLLVLTDPFWGPPADVMFIYLNRTRGIEVHEAWWLEISEDYPLLPPGNVPLMKSHYQRVFDKEINLRMGEPVYYVTDSDYFPSYKVYRRDANALLVASFKKPDSSKSIDIYRLR